MTYTLPLRRTILHFGQRLPMDADTFIIALPFAGIVRANAHWF